MEREHEAGFLAALAWRLVPAGLRDQRVILHAAVERAHEGALVRLFGPAYADLERRSVQHSLLVRRSVRQFELHLTVPFLLRGRSLQTKTDLADAQSGNRRQFAYGRWRARAGGLHLQIVQAVLAGVDDDHRRPGARFLADEQIRQGRIAQIERHRSFRRHELGTKLASAHLKEKVVAALPENDRQMQVTVGIRIAAAWFAVDMDRAVPGRLQ